MDTQIVSETANETLAPALPSVAARHVLRETFIHPDTYEALAERIAAITPDPLEGKVTRDQVKQALQTFGNIWPGRTRNPFAP